jgi:hypothetical protein
MNHTRISLTRPFVVNTQWVAAIGILALLLAGGRLVAIGAEEGRASKGEPIGSRVYEGQVLSLAEVVKTQSPDADEDALAISRVLRTKDGKIYSLVKDDASRKLFLDDRLLRRPLRITARHIAGSQLLVVVQVQSVVKGELHDIDYWCERCQLAATEPGICKCCGNTLELRELPVEPQPSTPSPKR